MSQKIVNMLDYSTLRKSKMVKIFFPRHIARKLCNVRPFMSCKTEPLEDIILWVSAFLLVLDNVVSFAQGTQQKIMSNRFLKTGCNRISLN